MSVNSAKNSAELQLDKEFASMRPGQKVTGTLRLKIQNPDTEQKEIRIKLATERSRKWIVEKLGLETTKYKGRGKTFTVVVPIDEFMDRRVVGDFKFPFEFVVPDDSDAAQEDGERVTRMSRSFHFYTPPESAPVVAETARKASLSTADTSGTFPAEIVEDQGSYSDDETARSFHSPLPSSAKHFQAEEAEAEAGAASAAGDEEESKISGSLLHEKKLTDNIEPLSLDLSKLPPKQVPIFTEVYRTSLIKLPHTPHVQSPILKWFKSTTEVKRLGLLSRGFVDIECGVPASGPGDFLSDVIQLYLRICNRSDSSISRVTLETFEISEFVFPEEDQFVAVDQENLVDRITLQDISKYLQEPNQTELAKIEIRRPGIPSSDCRYILRVRASVLLSNDPVCEIPLE
jgi:hypothetical protein